jgi:3-hydroxyacyl-CoA dehydrogenase
MIVSGEPISAAEALKSGLIDEIIDGSSTTAGETFARTILAGKIPMRRLRDDDTKLLAASNDRTIFTNAVAAVTKRNRGLQPCDASPPEHFRHPRTTRR